MKKKTSKATVHPLDQFSHYVSGAIKSFFELLRTWRQAPALPVAAVPGAAAKPTGRPAKAVEPTVTLRNPGKGLHQPSGQFPWDQILKIARRLLAKNPQRSWRIGELCHAVKAAGADVVSATGMHFGLLPRLKAEHLIVEKGNGQFTAFLGKGVPEAKPVAKLAKPAGPAKTAPPPAKKVDTAFPWDTVVSAARKLLKKDPTRRWSSSELCMAVKAQASLESAKGLHLTLPPRLKAEGLISEKNGAFVAKLTVEKEAAANVPARRSEKATAKVAVKKAKKATPAPVAKKAETKPEATPEALLNEKLIAACEKLLEAYPFKVWSGSDLVKALRDTGFKLPTWSGRHLTLPAILRKARLVENEGKGFRAAVRPSVGSSGTSDSTQEPKSELRG